ncbi:MBL fold metallo-hydrolase [Fictibacillus iocasae]|uniref:MBL fold metallo-hydrolase n=1 Tax=Fictibacillus iocasae TaxID=2715437 RepID=A0ABW2NPB4_9BACL
MDRIIKITVPTPFAVGDVNAYLIVDGKELVLVDGGPFTKDAKEALTAEVCHAGYQMQDIKAAVITHYHPDHAGLAHWLQSEFGTKIVASSGSVPFFSDDSAFYESRLSFYSKLYKTHGMPQDLGEHELKKLKHYRSFCPSFLPDMIIFGSSLSILPEWEVLYVPGHSPDHIALYNSASSELIGGDVLLPHISSNALIEPDLDGSTRLKTLLQYRETLQHIRTLEPQTVYPGHGDVFHNAAALIEQRLNDHEQRAQHILRIITEEPSTAFSAAAQLFGRLYKKEAGLVLSEVLGHLDLLEERKLAMHELTIEKVKHYSAGVKL